jgi:hypothetical protein
MLSANGARQLKLAVEKAHDTKKRKIIQRRMAIVVKENEFKIKTQMKQKRKRNG